MPTVQQLVRQGRKRPRSRSKSPDLLACPQRRGGRPPGGVEIRLSSRRRREGEIHLRMTQKEVLDELKAIIVQRLRFDPRRAAEMTPDTMLPKGIEGSLGLDSLDFIELSVALEERFGLVIDEGQDLSEEFQSLDSLSRFVLAKSGPA